MLTPLLMLTDARFPSGGHTHSGGLEPAAGLLHDEDILRTFLSGRLSTAGLTTAGLAAAACAYARATEHAPVPGTGGENVGHVQGWDLLDAEADARTPSPAQRTTSRRQGRTLLRAVRSAWPGPYLDALAATPGGPHHPIVLGAAAASAGCTPREAALAAVYLAVSGPASAAVRLLGPDPLRVNAELARLAPRIEATADRAVREDLPCPSAPGLDLLAEAHLRSEVRLFDS